MTFGNGGQEAPRLSGLTAQLISENYWLVSALMASFGRSGTQLPDTAYNYCFGIVEVFGSLLAQKCSGRLAQL